MTATPNALPARTVDIRDVRPYHRNPRRISDRAVAKVAASIERFGYQNPIIVDSDLVIIAGHTRYAALRQLGVEQIAVIVSDLDPDRAAEYRVIDNRSAEYTEWDGDLLGLELREWETELLAEFFPDPATTTPVDGENVTPIRPRESVAPITAITTDDLERAGEDVYRPSKAREHPTIDITCPNCGQPITVDRSSIGL